MHWPTSSQKLRKAKSAWGLRKRGTQKKKSEAFGYGALGKNNEEEGGARDVQNTESHWQRLKSTFQRSRRLLIRPRTMRGPGRTGTLSSSAEWQ